MVSDNHMPTRGVRTGDRAQLILIAAIALAFIILSIVVVFNSVLYTQTMSSSSSIETTSDAQLAELEMARGVRGIAQDANLDGADVDNNSEMFVEQYHNATANRRPAVINVVSISETESARAINSNTIRSVILDSSARQVGHFALELESGSVNDLDRVKVTATNASDSDTTTSIRRDGDELVISPPDGASDCRFEHDNDPIVFDFTDDAIIGANVPGCSIKLIETADSYTEIIIDNASSVSGGYELVAQGGDSLRGDGSGHSAVWTVDLEYTYDTSELSVEREFEVDVYGDRR